MVLILPKATGFAEKLGTNLGAGLGAGLAEGVSKKINFSHELKREKRKQEAEREKQAALIEELVDHGIPEEQARLYAKFTTGGQTAFAKDILEATKRGMSNFGSKITKPLDKIKKATGIEQNAEQNEGMGKNPEEASSERFPEALEEINQDVDEGLTPAEKVRRGSERYKTNWPIYQEAASKLRGMQRDKERISILESIDKTGKLPKNLGRFNVDDEGNLRFPFASSAEAQRFVKTLNEFSANAKDTFGARVTNFDLQQYLLRFPNLLNSAEGRRQIYQQMKIVNDINAVYYKNLKNVYDKAGGVRNIDPDIAEQMAEKITEPQVERFVKKLEDIGSFPTLPSAQEHKGRTIRDKETGEILKSDGQNWIPVQ